jgi:hypothetical protein
VIVERFTEAFMLADAAFLKAIRLARRQRPGYALDVNQQPIEATNGLLAF